VGALNIHGDITATATQAGAKSGATVDYDSYGILITGTHPDNLNSSRDYTWLGQHQRPTELRSELQPTIEMGARQYSPLLGRFLEVDPVDGGSCNDYDYVCAGPFNSLDLDGNRKCTSAESAYARRVAVGIYSKGWKCNVYTSSWASLKKSQGREVWGGVWLVCPSIFVQQAAL
jgi:RHS repeat-associated protein